MTLAVAQLQLRLVLHSSLAEDRRVLLEEQAVLLLHREIVVVVSTHRKDQTKKNKRVKNKVNSSPKQMEIPPLCAIA